MYRIENEVSDKLFSDGKIAFDQISIEGISILEMTDKPVK